MSGRKGGEKINAFLYMYSESNIFLPFINEQKPLKIVLGNRRKRKEEPLP